MCEAGSGGTQPRQPCLEAPRQRQAVFLFARLREASPDGAQLRLNVFDLVQPRDAAPDFRRARQAGAGGAQLRRAGFRRQAAGPGALAAMRLLEAEFDFTQ